MILSDRSIKEEVKRRRIVFDPPFLDKDLSPSSVDVHLGDYIWTFKDIHPAIVQAIDLRHPDVASALVELTERTLIPDEGYDLQPKGFILAFTKEKLTLPDDIGARIEGRSTLARFGITVHATAPTIHPTWLAAPLMLELCNFGKQACKLTKGLAIAQLIFERLDSLPLKSLDTVWRKQKAESLRPQTRNRKAGQAK